MEARAAVALPAEGGDSEVAVLISGTVELR
jgi:hypothetical protein